MSRFTETKAKVLNRGVPPDEFLHELIDWANSAPDDIFAVNDRADIYSAVRGNLGPWEGLRHRKAVMLEVLRVLGGFESSWDWQCGHDTNNPSEDRDLTKSAGIFQVSADSLNFDKSLKDLTIRRVGTLDAAAFRKAMMSDKVFAIEYTARLLRFTLNHHGPIKRREVNQWLRRQSVREFEQLLA